MEDRRNGAPADGAKKAKAAGAEVGLDDRVLKEWNPTMPYENKPAQPGGSCAIR